MIYNNRVSNIKDNIIINMSFSPFNNISWYVNVYYSYRDYPIRHLNIKYKKSELKTIYNILFKKMLMNF